MPVSFARKISSEEKQLPVRKIGLSIASFQSGAILLGQWNGSIRPDGGRLPKKRITGSCAYKGHTHRIGTSCLDLPGDTMCVNSRDTWSQLLVFRCATPALQFHLLLFRLTQLFHSSIPFPSTAPSNWYWRDILNQNVEWQVQCCRVHLKP